MNGHVVLKSILIVIKDEYYAKGITLSLLDYFQSIHTSKNPYEALEIVKKEEIDIVITELSFNTVDPTKYLESLTKYMSEKTSIIIIQDTSLNISEYEKQLNIIIKRKPVSVKSIINEINTISINKQN